MKKITDMLGISDQKPTRGGINSRRSNAVANLLVFMGEDATLESERNLEKTTPGAGRAKKKERIAKRMRYWLGRTRDLSPDDLFELMSRAKGGKNKQALFNHLLKNHGKKIPN